jgi:hypothetical protein
MFLTKSNRQENPIVENKAEFKKLASITNSPTQIPIKSIIYTEDLSNNKFSIPNNWKYFSLKDLNVSLGYPQDWQEVTWRNYDFVKNDLQGGATIFRAYSKEINGLKGYLDKKGVIVELYTNKPYKNVNYTENNYTVNGYEGILSVEKKRETFTIHQKDKDIALIIKYYEPSIEDIKVAQQVISSFKLSSSTNNYIYKEIWSTVTNKSGTRSITVPSNASTDISNDYFDIFISGPTQIADTEIYDGALVKVHSDYLEDNQTILDFVNKQYEKEKKDISEYYDLDGESTISKPEKIILTSGLSGYRLITDGRIEAELLYLQNRSSKEVICIYKVVADSTNQGYEDTARKIVNSFRIIK